MTYTPQELQELELPRPANKRAPAYDAGAVDDLLDAVARQIEGLQGALSEQEEREAETSARLAEVENRLREYEEAGGPEKAEEVRNTLTLLQTAEEIAAKHVREAEELVAEAREESNRIRTEAAESAEALLAQAREEAESTVRAAQEEADRISADARDLVENASRRAQEKVDAVLAEGTARRDELNAQITAAKKELSRVEAHREKRLALFRQQIRDLEQELVSGEAAAVSAAATPVPVVETATPSVDEDEAVDLALDEDYAAAADENDVLDLGNLDEDEGELKL